MTLAAQDARAAADQVAFETIARLMRYESDSAATRAQLRYLAGEYPAIYQRAAEAAFAEDNNV